jgi:hypothetical protein
VLFEYFQSAIDWQNFNGVAAPGNGRGAKVEVAQIVNLRSRSS